MRTIILCCLLTGCATQCPPQQTRIVDTACDWIPHMTASSSDTTETKRQILAYEIARQKNCK